MNLAASLHAASVIQFAAARFIVAENVGPATLTVQRTADLDTPVSVDFATADGSATHGSDYTGVTNTLLFAAGETLKRFIVPILNDSLKEEKVTGSVANARCVPHFVDPGLVAHVL